jgi:hypothetical protein
MLHMLASIVEHPLVLLCGIALGYLLPSDVLSILSLIKSKLP